MHPRAHRGRRRRSAGFGSQAILVAGLILITCAGIGFALRTYLTGPAVQGSTAEGIHFRCDKCGDEFIVAFREMDLQKQNTPTARLRLDCPACGAEGSSLPEVKCPACGKYFVPISYSDPAAKRAGRAKDVCPHCKTDRDQWYRELYRTAR